MTLNEPSEALCFHPQTPFQSSTEHTNTENEAQNNCICIPILAPSCLTPHKKTSTAEASQNQVAILPLPRAKACFPGWVGSGPR